LLEEGLDPWRGLRETWIMGPGSKSVLVDITETIERKLDALMCHVSQIGEDRSAVEGWLKAYLAEAGASAGYDYAETFGVIAQGPGFHADEQEDLEGFVPAKEPWAPVDPRSAPA
jgi:LmbE family N-acetylglucosaminyl deacetylase